MLGEHTSKNRRFGLGAFGLQTFNSSLALSVGHPLVLYLITIVFILFACQVH